jgi:O-methyltransferase
MPGSDLGVDAVSSALIHPWPAPPPLGYLGQLEPAFQAQLAAATAGLHAGDCSWYHTTELSDGTIKQDIWDLRGREPAYVGNLALDGRSVLELGPASGYLTFYMEGQGAR